MKGTCTKLVTGYPDKARNYWNQHSAGSRGHTRRVPVHCRANTGRQALAGQLPGKRTRARQVPGGQASAGPLPVAGVLPGARRAAGPPVRAVILYSAAILDKCGR